MSSLSCTPESTGDITSGTFKGPAPASPAVSAPPGLSSPVLQPLQIVTQPSPTTPLPVACSNSGSDSEASDSLRGFLATPTPLPRATIQDSDGSGNIRGRYQRQTARILCPAKTPQKVLRLRHCDGRLGRGIKPLSLPSSRITSLSSTSDRRESSDGFSHPRALQREGAEVFQIVGREVREGGVEMNLSKQGTTNLHLC
jgi:hypothetical protein